jgi:hypothetical protein
MQFKHLITAILVMVAGVSVASQLPAVLEPFPNWEKSVTYESDPNFSAAYGSYNATPGRFDRNADGRVDLIVTDRNNDGRGDYWATDRNFDGVTDDYQYDRNFDGRIDQWEYDYDGDGIPDKIFVDANRDGIAEMYAEWNPMTRTYSWYGTQKSLTASVGIRPKKRLKKGRAADSK